MQLMKVNDINIEVEKKAIKNMHLSVYPPDGHVHVSAPIDMSETLIKSYVLRKMAWIIAKRKEMTSYIREENREYVSGEAHYFLGNLYRLKVIRTNTEIQHVVRDGDYLQIFVRDNAKPKHIENVLYEWYREELKQIVDDYVKKWTKILDVNPQGWEIRLMSSKWGSCTRKTKRLLFNLQLAKKPLICIEYIVLHEMTHLIEPTHSNKFKLILDRHLPNWEEIQKQLNELPI